MVSQARTPPSRGLFLNAIRVLFDDGVGEDFAGDALNLFANGAGREPLVKRESEILALPHSGHIGKPDLAQGIVDGLALRVQDRCLQRDIDMCLHYPRLYKDHSRLAGSGWPMKAVSSGRRPARTRYPGLI